MASKVFSDFVRFCPKVGLVSEMSVNNQGPLPPPKAWPYTRLPVGEEICCLVKNVTAVVPLIPCDVPKQQDPLMSWSLPFS